MGSGKGSADAACLGRLRRNASTVRLRMGRALVARDSQSYRADSRRAILRLIARTPDLDQVRSGQVWLSAFNPGCRTWARTRICTSAISGHKPGFAMTISRTAARMTKRTRCGAEGCFLRIIPVDNNASVRWTQIARIGKIPSGIPIC